MATPLQHLTINSLVYEEDPKGTKFGQLTGKACYSSTCLRWARNLTSISAIFLSLIPIAVAKTMCQLPSTPATCLITRILNYIDMQRTLYIYDVQLFNINDR